MASLSLPEAGIRIERSQDEGRNATFVAGVLCVVVLPLTIGNVSQQDWGAVLIVLAIPPMCVVVGKCCDRFARDKRLVLYPACIDTCWGHGKSRSVAWADVTSIRWPDTQNNASDATVRIELAANSDWPHGRMSIALQNFSPADRLKLIRYLRTVDAKIEQPGWASYCHMRVIPLIESLEREKQIVAEGNREMPHTVSQWTSRFPDRRPFVGGVFYPFWFVWRLPRLTSQKRWWLVATIIAVSGVVNIHLIWGEWVSPFTEYVVVAVSILFFLGLLARNDDEPVEPEQRLPMGSFMLSLCILLIGVPLLGNASALEWMSISHIPGELFAWAIVLVLFFPSLVLRSRQKRRQKRHGPALEAGALRRWEAFVETGTLPRPSVHPP